VQRLLAGARAERTSNIRSMVVTLDVSQFDMSALKLFKLWKSSLMSVTAETSQSAMGPYTSVAVATPALCAATAVLRELLLVKA